MKPFSLLVKPAGADCNLRCAYCFYLDHRDLYPSTQVHRMSDEVLTAMIRSYLSVPMPQYAFGWQGGEPTLMGAAFFKRVTELQQQYGRRGAVISNGLQTNGTRITDELAAHLAEYRFLVGVSLDGPAHLHDHYRVSAAGQGTHAEVLKGISKLRTHGVEHNILTLVNDANVGHAREVYHYLVEQGFLYQQYIPCVEFDPSGARLPFAIDSRRWGDFLCELYDCWQAHDTRRVSIRLFDAIVAYLADGARTVCNMGHSCCQYFVVEHTGDIYPCDFFVEKELCLGNVTHMSWEQAERSPVYRAFGARKAHWHQMCDECPYLDVCAGDCQKHRLFGGADSRNRSWLCAGWKQFYDHALPGLRALATQVVNERRQAMPALDNQPRPATTPPPGRNDPCPCGSGKKYKRCCMTTPRL